MMKITRLNLHRSPARGVVEFYLALRERDETYLAKPVVMEKLDQAAFADEPTFTMSDEDAQAFIDQLWREGYRPTIIESEGGFTAQGRHLEDMRKIAFMFLAGMEAK